jgi:hypothetical protein
VSEIEGLREPVKVLMTPELIEQWASRDIHGRRLTWAWPEPDADGFVTPVITSHTDDKLFCPCEQCTVYR